MISRRNTDQHASFSYAQLRNDHDSCFAFELGKRLKGYSPFQAALNRRFLLLKKIIEGKVNSKSSGIYYCGSFGP